MHIYRTNLNFEKRTRNIVICSLVLSSQLLHENLENNKRNIIEQRPKTTKLRIQSNSERSQKIRPRPSITKELKWLKIKEKHVSDTCTAMFKTMHGSCPEWLLSIKTVIEAPGNITRQNNNLYVPRTRTDSGARSLAVLGPKLWNELPTCNKGAPNLQIFRHRLKNCLLSVG